MSNIKLTIAYDGSGYCGWQVQKGRLTIQGVLEESLSRIEKKPVTLYGAGRTDAKVHAWGQTANFHTDVTLPPLVWQKAINRLLPKDIVIKEAVPVPDDFHARHSALHKHYRYRILLSKFHCPFERNYAWHIPYRLDLDAMKRAADYLLGEHNFSSFQGTGSDIETTVRNMEGLTLELRENILQIDLTADGFLRHMVRNIVGTLVEVGRGKLFPDAITEILAARDRSKAGQTAPPQGLCLISVGY
ncbi:MAG: tRNA pseudouridine(38-40) synthase TruA [Candidatus Schekmanbacteria bacterium]|nr:tRNA pseudouridine(38-40) synthase TruA [Candidatus Schekmanbacteria bacterium]